MSHEAEEYMRLNFPKTYQSFLERKPEWAEQLNKDVLSKGGERYGLISAVTMARTALAKRATFHLGGILVDQQGRPCPNVTIEVGKKSISIGPKGWPDNGDLCGSVQVTGSFAIRVEDAQGVQLGIHKPGYYTVRTLHFLAPEPVGARMWEIVLTGKTVPPQVVEKRNLRIVLEKQGLMTRLVAGGGELNFYHDGTGDVLEIKVNADGSWFMQGTRETGISIAPPKHLPEKSVYLVPKTESKGRIVLMKLSALQSRRAREARIAAKHEGTFVVPDDESQYVYAPTEVRLVVSDPEGGFVRYEPKPGGEIGADRPWSRDMKEAPQEGYVHELLLDDGAIKKLFADPDEPQPVSFYIKAFGKFGKGKLDHLRIILKEAKRRYVNGRLEPIRFLLDESRLTARIEILMQPDGRRNLEGYED
jgi:hypothetical protein